MGRGFHIGGTRWRIEPAGTIGLGNTAIDQNGDSFSVTGLSGVVWSGGESFAAVMDNSNHVVFLHVEFENDALAAASSTGGLTLDRSGDYEDISVNGDGDILLADEGTQQIIRFDLEGAPLETVDLPPIYLQHRSNLGCESFDLGDDEEVWIANEEALLPDGPRATPDHGTWVRVLRGDASGDATQFGYEVDAMPGPYFPFTGDGQSGLVAIVPLPDGTLLAVERSLAFAGAFFETRMYQVTMEGATDVSDFPTLDGATFTPVTKTALYVGPHQNMEGLCLGPDLGDGRRALLGIVDDGDPLSSNRVVAFILGGLATCDSDLDGSGAVDTDDLLALIGQWGTCGGTCEADLDQSGEVGADDLLELLSQWGPCS